MRLTAESTGRIRAYVMVGVGAAVLIAYLISRLGF
jgi:hypothetical protein